MEYHTILAIKPRDDDKGDVCSAHGRDEVCTWP
jgi:hypothetical protein